MPLLSAAFLLLLPWVAFRPAVRPYLSGLFDPIDARALLIITPLALFNAWTVVIIAGLILTYGRARLDLPPVRVRLFPLRAVFWLLGALLAVPVVGRTIWYMAVASDHSAAAVAGATAGGLALAVALLFLTIVVTALLSRGGHRLRSAEPGAFHGRVARMVKTFVHLYDRVLESIAARPALAAGFVHRRDDRVELLEGHGLALGLATASVLLYVATGVLTSDVQRPTFASTLAYLLLLNLVLTWLAGVLAFLFDRSRLPLLLLAAAWILFVNSVLHPVFSTGHIYRTVPLPAAAPAPAPPAALLSDVDAAIVVAASGGGIQAAAWTSTVLTSLGRVPGFAERLRLVSAVSGGSVGAMYVLGALPECGPAGGDAAFDAAAAASESSLHAVGWGLVFKDLPRTFLPFFSSPYVDRGSLLEDAWKREPRLRRAAPDPSSFLSSWRARVATGRCPAVVYNAMAAETGDPVLFATVRLPPTLEAFDFYARYPGRDVPVTTAARLSATFPYVSPAARADVDDESGGYTHVVDGGYFDNYGVSSLAAVVHEALTALPPRQEGPRRLLVLEVCDSAKCSGDPAPAVASVGGEDRGWPYQLVAPLSAMVAMRSAAQRANNRTTLRLLKDYWRTQGTCIESLPLAFGEGGTPMSWHLTGRERRAIDEAWRRIEARTMAAVERFLRGSAATDEAGRCGEGAREGP